MRQEAVAAGGSLREVGEAAGIRASPDVSEERVSDEAMDLLAQIVAEEPVADGYCVFCWEYVDFGGTHEGDCLIARAKALLGTYRRAG